MMNSKVFVLGVFLALLVNLAHASTSTVNFNACIEGKEHFRLSDQFDPKIRSDISDALEQKWSGSRVFELGFKLSDSKNKVEVQEIGNYLKARSYFREGLHHIAYEKMREFFLGELPKEGSLASRYAALECMVQIQRVVTPLSFEKAILNRMFEMTQNSKAISEKKEIVNLVAVMRIKELLNRWDADEIQKILTILKNEKSYLTYAQALLVQRHGQYSKAIGFWERLLEKGELPSAFFEDRDTLLIFYARDLYETKNFAKSAEILRKVPLDSNYLAQALSDLSWALLLDGKISESIGAAFNIQKSLLTRVYAPEAPIVASIGYQEQCQYARALKNAVFFKKKYLPILLWYRRLTPEQQSKPYEILTQSLRRKGGVPNLVLLEWLRSPEFRALQGEVNFLFDEKKKAYKVHGERVIASRGAPWVKDWKKPIAPFYNSVDRTLRALDKRLNQSLDLLSQRMMKQIAKAYENIQFLEIEIFDAAGEDMVWRNVNADYVAWAEKQPKESKPKDLFWEWGEIPVDPKSKDEIWEDELGYTASNVSDECKMKKKFKEFKSQKVSLPVVPSNDV